MSKKRILFFTSTRADYGLLEPLLERFFGSSLFHSKLLITGTHLLKSFGNTIEQIKPRFREDALEVSIFKEDEKDSLSSLIANSLVKFESVLQIEKPDLIFVLGDRFEAFSCCLAAFNLNLALAHLHGGELTFGAIDDTFRHMMSKMSTLHFPSSSKYAERIIRLGEKPSHVFNVGGLFVENVLKDYSYTRKELLEELGLEDQDFYLVTYHPLTLGEESIDPLLSVLKDKKLAVVFTAPNIDPSQENIIGKIETFIQTKGNSVLVHSLGTRRYLAACHYAKAVLGNSSSGITEVPALGTGVLNIGLRQEGRLRSFGVIDVKMNEKQIQDGLSQLELLKSVDIKQAAFQLYGDGSTSEKIFNIITNLDWSILKNQKGFYDG